MKARAFIIYVLIILLALLAGLFALFKYQLGSAMSSEWWVKSVYDYKLHIAQNTSSPKVIVIAGSNALFGIDSRILEQKTGRPVVNLAIHAGLDPEFLYQQLKETLRAEDWVVMPLEYEYYSPSDEYSGWFVSNMLAWGEDIYLNKLDLMEYASFLKAVSVEDVWKGLLSTGVPSKLIDTEQVIKDVGSLNRQGLPAYEGYSHRSLTTAGDILPDSRSHARVIEIEQKTGDPYLKKLDRISERFLVSFNKIRALIEERDARLMVTWPVSIRNRSFDLASPEAQGRVTALARQLREAGISLACEPALFNMYFALFHDNRYHLNRKGAMIRSVNLGDCINRVLAENTERDDLKFNHSDAIKILRFQERSVLSAR